MRWYFDRGLELIFFGFDLVLFCTCTPSPAQTVAAERAEFRCEKKMEGSSGEQEKIEMDEKEEEEEEEEEEGFSSSTFQLCSPCLLAPSARSWHASHLLLLLPPFCCC
jgi:hypothetical protein